MRLGHSALTVLIALLSSGCAMINRVPHAPTKGQRFDILTRARVWSPTTIASMDLARGPQGPGSFDPGAQVTCDYVNERLGGHSPKFLCRVAEGDDVKIKYGIENGEVYGELLATRLLWALGFGADREYQVDVICRGCPESLGGVAGPGKQRRFFPALLERKMAGHEWKPGGRSGWAWTELDVPPAAEGATAAQRDALKLLAVFLQHTDSKTEQQRILCLEMRRSKESESCEQPFLMISDVGLTFGRADLRNRNAVASVNLDGWRHTPIWKSVDRCVGNLSKSFSGTLADPVISEAGRQFLAELLMQLTDRQLTDLFAAARVDLRLTNPLKASSDKSTVEEWVSVFKAKRQEIVERRCA
jgi:hypothetical protein